MEPNDSSRDEQQLFRDIISSQEMHDEGINLRDAAIRECESEIRKRFVKKGFAEIPAEDLEAFEDQINEAWQYLNEVATVSGTLETLNAEDEDLLEALFGDIAIPNIHGETIALKDDDGCHRIDVLSARLKSGGIIIDTLGDTNTGALLDVRVGYVFYLLSDENENVPLFAQPNVLSKHEYDIPTAAEACVRLEKNWPEQVNTLNQILFNNDPITKKLLSIASALNEQLSDSIFCSLVELYVNEELALHVNTPYMTVVKKSIEYLDDIEIDDSAWHRLRINQLLTLFVTAPEIRFSSPIDDVSTVPTPYINGVTFNDEYGYKPEIIAIPVQNIENFVSTRASMSLGGSAIAAVDFEINQDVINKIEQQGTVEFEDIEFQNDGTPEYILELETLVEALQRVQLIGDEFRGHIFTNQADAEEDARILIQKIREYLNGTIFFQSNQLIEAMGTTIYSANLRYNLQWNEEINAFVHGQDASKPVRELPLGDKVVGKSGHIYAITEKMQSEENDEAIFYIPQAVLGVITSTGRVDADQGGPVLSQLSVQNQSIIPLDSSTEIQFPILDQYKANRVAIEKAVATYGESSPIVRRIRQLEEALLNEDPNGFVNLETTLIARFAIDLARVVRRHKKSVTPAIEVLETMFADRNIIANSDVFLLDVNGQYRGDDGRSGKLCSWRIIDIQSDQTGEEVMLFVASANDELYRYIPASSVTEFQF